MSYLSAFQVVMYVSLQLNMEPESFGDQIWRRMEYILQNSSCHGGNWVMKLSNSKIKTAGTVLVFFFQLVTFYIITSMIFGPTVDFSTSLLWDSEEIIFPNITICNPRIYDRKKVQGNIADNKKIHYR